MSRKHSWSRLLARAPAGLLACFSPPERSVGSRLERAHSFSSTEKRPRADHLPVRSSLHLGVWTCAPVTCGRCLATGARQTRPRFPNYTGMCSSSLLVRSMRPVAAGANTKRPIVIPSGGPEGNWFHRLTPRPTGATVGQAPVFQMPLFRPAARCRHEPSSVSR